MYICSCVYASAGACMGMYMEDKNQCLMSSITLYLIIIIAVVSIMVMVIISLILSVF